MKANCSSAILIFSLKQQTQDPAYATGVSVLFTISYDALGLPLESLHSKILVANIGRFRFLLILAVMAKTAAL